MSLTVQQLLSDAKRLTGRLRDHDSAADSIINSAQDVLKEVEAMRQYQEDIESLNTIAHNRPRAQLVLGKSSVSYFKDFIFELRVTILKKKHLKVFKLCKKCNKLLLECRL